MSVNHLQGFQSLPIIYYIIVAVLFVGILAYLWINEPALRRWFGRK